MAWRAWSAVRRLLVREAPGTGGSWHGRLGAAGASRERHPGPGAQEAPPRRALTWPPRLLPGRATSAGAERGGHGPGWSSGGRWLQLPLQPQRPPPPPFRHSRRGSQRRDRVRGRGLVGAAAAIISIAMSRLSQLLLLTLLVFPAALLLGGARGGPGEGGRASGRPCPGAGSGAGGCVRVCAGISVAQRGGGAAPAGPAEALPGGGDGSAHSSPCPPAHVAAAAGTPAPGPVPAGPRPRPRAPGRCRAALRPVPAQRPAVMGRAPRAPASGPAVTAARESRRAPPEVVAAGLSFSPLAPGAGSHIT